MTADGRQGTAARANTGRTVAVIGGGIGGLAAALAFARTGAQVTVFEQAPELREFGAGLQITPNGGVVLKALGLEAAATARSVRGEAVVPSDALTGREIARFDLTRLDGIPYRFFHRGDLLEILAEGCRGAGVVLRTGVRIGAASPEEGRISIAGGEILAFDVIVGADGLHSVLRPVLNGPDKPFFTGQVAWRAVIDAPGAAPEARIWMAPGRHIVTYPLAGRRLNIVAVQARRGWTDEGWNHPDDPENLRSAFSDCAPEIKAMLEKVGTARLWGLFRHPVAPNWQRGRAAILGDAAHPTLPFLAQGANLALEDAYVLAHECDRSPDLGAALAAYELARQSRVRKAIAAANGNAINYHLAGVSRRMAHAGLRTLGVVAPQMFLRRMDWLYGHDVTA
jgi:salicylate hydroxylase